MIKRMQFTFSIDTPPGSFPATSSSSYTFSGEGSTATAPTKPDLRPSAEFREGRRRKRDPPRSSATNTSSENPLSTSASGSSSNDNVPSSQSAYDASYEKFLAYEKLHFPPLFSTSFGPTALLYSTPTLTNPMSYGEGVSGGCATGFSIMRPTIELPLDELLEAEEAEERMAEAYAQAHAEDMKEDGSDDIDMPYDDYPTTEGNGDGNSNGNFLQDGSTIVSAAAPSSQQTQDILMSDSRQHQPAPESDTNTNANTFPHLSQPPTHSHSHAQSHPRTRAKDRSGKNTPTNRPVLTVQTSSGTKKSGKGRRASAAGVKSPSSSVTPAPSASVIKNSTTTTSTSAAKHATATATTLNPSLLLGSTTASGGGGGKTTLSAPGGVKAECSNCGATHTPLWRRGLNDELNCNACGLYCKLHKRPRPKSMRASHGEARRGGASSLPSSLSSAAAPPVASPVVPAGESANTSAAATSEAPNTGMAVSSGRGEVVEIIGSAQCYNCHTTATPLWRKDDEGKTVCNACGLYYKLHGSARPISMKSDIIRKRSRHDARAPRTSLTEATSASNTPGTPSEPPSQTQTPSASPSVSRRPTPSPSPILAPDSTTQPVASHGIGVSVSAGMVGTGMSLGGSSELMGALGDTYAVYNPFPGPYHPDYLSQNWVQPAMASAGAGANDALPFAGVDSLDGDSASSSDSSQKDNGNGSNGNQMNPNANGNGNANANANTTGRTAKRRRMSTDSVSEPPSSAVSYSSYGGDSFTASTGPTSASSSSRRSSMDFPFFSPYTIFRGNGNNAFWHHSSGGGAERSPQFIHPPMLPEGVGASSASVSSSDSRGHGHGHGHGHLRHGHGGMDFLHPPMMLPQDEESLFAAYLHPPMTLPQEGEQVQHGYDYGQGEYYETGGMQQY
ncbi:hypothetical protein K503DRAFT_170783 [Rhizopogon vinicolor AM-OR11-026]|uniref:GATA-type domain-containing protein n=1 Tax=Rhizopogon vinicolor AM-OR11-026 TaxID=1314800 RepID=A0A1B7N0A2_9AGAM|nr:hypothetical protein K503DRAFT_170783 [Rhizopogon vinicolor AM-OR11-026]